MKEDNCIDGEGRKFIEKSLDDKHTFVYIARKLGVHPTTILREVLRNRIVREGRINARQRRNICRFKPICTAAGICDPRCQSPCKSCSKVNCNDRCELFEPKQCERLEKKPYVCNGCDLLDFKGLCDCERSFYDAIEAQRMTEERKLNAGRKVALTPEEITSLTKMLKAELKKGHSPEYIWRNSVEPPPITVRTFYNYVERGYFEELKMHLPKYVTRRPKKKGSKAEKPPNPVYDGRRYEDFLKLPEDVRERAVELDCVEGKKDGCKKVMLTMLFRDDRFQIMMLLATHTKTEVKRALDRIERLIGLEAFEAHFGTILTDHGHEFNDFELLEASCTVEGRRRCTVFFCDPSRPDQKGACERNHVELRRIIPKGKSFKKLTQADVELAASHVNSYGRPVLEGAAPIELASKRLPAELLAGLGLKKIAPNDVLMKPSLLPHLM